LLYINLVLHYVCTFKVHDPLCTFPAQIPVALLFHHYSQHLLCFK